MKFYFEGQKIRESKTHHYTHALIKRTENGVICLACSSSQKGAEKPKNDRIREIERAIESAERRIKALEAGKNGYQSKGYGFVKFSEIHESIRTVEGNREAIEDNQRCLEEVRKWEVVEIEERA